MRISDWSSDVCSSYLTTPECVHVEVFRWLELPAVPVAALRSIHLEEQLRLVCTVEATRVDVRQHRQSIHRQEVETARTLWLHRLNQFVRVSQGCLLERCRHCRPIGRAHV